MSWHWERVGICLVSSTLKIGLALFPEGRGAFLKADYRLTTQLRTMANDQSQAKNCGCSPLAKSRKLA